MFPILKASRSFQLLSRRHPDDHDGEIKSGVATLINEYPAQNVSGPGLKLSEIAVSVTGNTMKIKTEPNM
jgi:hypothetical protein